MVFLKIFFFVIIDHYFPRALKLGLSKLNADDKMLN